MQKLPVSVTLITLNEEQNIARALRSVQWANEIIVVDSGSTDKTIPIAKAMGAKVFSRDWEGYGQQKNFAHAQATQEWVLNLDADEEVSPELFAELTTAVTGTTAFAGYFIPRKTFFVGQWIKNGGWYPGYIKRLSKKGMSRWTEPAVHEDLQIDGPVGQFSGAILHHSFPSVESQVLTNLKYAKLGARDLARRNRPATVAHLLFKPWGKFISTYFLKSGFRDGLRGFLISVNAAYSIFLKYAFRIEERDLGNKS